MLDVELIRQFIEMMVQNDLTEVSLRDGEEEINLRRPGPASSAHSVLAPPQLAAAPPPPPVAAAAPVEAPAAPAGDPDAGLAAITSPMVGTFYSSSSPDAPPFVQVGSEVHPETVVCILEAMKVFNEIKAEIAGRIERILVKNGQAVEYGQRVFLVRPA